MWRGVACCLVLAALGCRNPSGSTAPRLDPFMGRNTVPPPATGARALAPAQPGGSPTPLGPAAPPVFGATPPPANSWSGAGSAAVPPASTPPAHVPPAQFPPAGSFNTASTGGSRIAVPQTPLPSAAINDPRYRPNAIDIMDLPVSNTARGAPYAPRQSFRVRVPPDGTHPAPETVLGWDVQTVSYDEPWSPTTITVLDRRESTYDFDTDYRWLMGRLEYSAFDRRWSLRYIAPEESTDSLGGHVALVDSELLGGFKSGDFVTVQGELDSRGPRHTALFRLERIELQSQP